jgi:hypothetical protein
MRASEAAKMVAVLRAAFPRDKVGDETSPVYERYLADLEATEVWPVIDELVATRKWFPTVSEIRGLTIQRRVGAPSVARCFEAIAHYDKTARNVPRVRASEFLHPLASTALKLSGGLHGYRGTTSPGVWRSQFRKIYEELLAERLVTENVQGRAQLAGDGVKGVLNA